MGIRLTAYADTHRDMWISVGSNVYRRDEGGIYFGWHAELSTEPKVIELYFKDGQLPVWMPAPEDRFEIDEITKYVTSMNFSPVAAEREEGMLKIGEHDAGFVQFDNVEFIVGE